MYRTDFRKMVETDMDPPLHEDGFAYLSFTRGVRKNPENQSSLIKTKVEDNSPVTHLQVLSMFQDGSLVKFKTMGQRIRVKIPTQGKAL